MLARHVALAAGARRRSRSVLSLALMEALNDIGACEYLGVRTLTLSIFTTWLNRSSLPGAAQIACVMLVAIAALIALERYGQRDKRFHFSVRRAQPPAPIVLGGWAAAAAFAACLLPVLLGFLLPASDLAVEAVRRRFDPELLRAASTPSCSPRPRRWWRSCSASAP
jgi:iron(III) transport system permease protein